VKRDKRFCPSESDSKLLIQMLRVHSFLKHEEIEFFDLRTFDIDHKTADLLSRFLQTNIDVPDAILRMEEIAMDRKYFTDFLSKYLAEEYSIQEDYSFTVIALLHYLRKKQVSLDDAITELLSLSSNMTICALCCSAGQNLEDKNKIVNVHNYEILKALNSNEIFSDEDLSSSDDSTGDPQYRVEKPSDTSSEEIEDRMEDVDHSSEKNIGFNPFDSSDDEEVEKPTLNSTISFNPFEDSENESISEEKTSSTKKSIECDHCKKRFSNRHNMKIHLIGWVILF
jgi:hypothetical protein